MNIMKSADDSVIEAQTILDFFTDIFETSKNSLKYHLSEDVVLDWFGKTIKGQKNVAQFIKHHVNPIRHLFGDAKPVSQIGFRDTHVIRVERAQRRLLRSAFMSPPRLTIMTTPVKQNPSTSAKRRIGLPDLDVYQNNNNKSPPSLQRSPRKRQKTSPPILDSSDIDIVECENDISQVDIKYLTAEGHVEFHRPSLKKLQSETKWQRPCKIHVAYECGRDIKDSSFYLIIYEGNMGCRKNLLKDFDDVEQE